MTAPELNDRETLAVEHAMRLLEGEELLMARTMAAEDPAFAEMVAGWEDRLAPLLDEIAVVKPGPEVWTRIENETASLSPKGEVIVLRKSIRRWQFASGLSAAAAVALAFFAFIQPAQSPMPEVTSPMAQAPLMANIPIADTPLRLAVTYVPGRSDLLVSASGLTADGVHDHELWLVMPEGAPRSLGVIIPGEERRVPLDPELASAINSGSQIVLSREPLGGAPKGGAAGPVVAQGQFTST